MVLGGVPLEQRLREMTADVRAYDAVAVVGAGLSAYRYPMTKELPALLWQAIEEVEGAAQELAKRAERDGSPKDILGTHPESVAPGWQLARDLPQVRAAFQRTTDETSQVDDDLYAATRNSVWLGVRATSTRWRQRRFGPGPQTVASPPAARVLRGVQSQLSEPESATSARVSGRS